MTKGLYILLEGPKPKPGVTRILPDISGGSTLDDLTNTDSDDSTSSSGGILSNNKSHSVDKMCKRLHKPGEAELIPEPFKSELESAVADAESNDKSSYVADHLCYMDTDEPYLALAGRTQSNEDYYFEIIKDGSDWRWIDVEDNDKAKPFEQY